MNYFTIIKVCLIFLIIIAIFSFIAFYKFKYIFFIRYEKEKVVYSILFSFWNIKFRIKDGQMKPFDSSNKGKRESDILGQRLFKDVLLSNCVTYENINLKVIAGCSDVVVTAMGYGIGSMFLSTVPIVLRAMFNIKNVVIKFVPVFKQNKLEISIKCIVRLKNADIINILYKDKILRWWNSWRIQSTS